MLKGIQKIRWARPIREVTWVREPQSSQMPVIFAQSIKETD